MARIMEQFPLVRQRDEQAHGRYRTRDRMLDTQRTGRPVQTALGPPSGDPAAAHPAAGEGEERGSVRRPERFSLNAGLD